MALELYIGEITNVGFDFAPRGYTHCAGQLLAIAQNSALFSLLGTTYGGDGRTSFGLPDLRGRTPVGAGTGPGLTPRRLGQKDGTDENHIGVDNLPSHTHSISTSSTAGAATATVRASSKPGLFTGPAEGSIWAKDTFATAKIYNNEDPDVTLSSKAIDVNVTLNLEKVRLNDTGGRQPLNNRGPELVINSCIALVGKFPNRN